MRNALKDLTCCLAVCLALAGCGGDSADSSPQTGQAEPDKADPGEVVVEPSAAKLTENGEDSLAVLRELLTGDELEVPPGYTIKIDDAFKRANRLRFVLAPDKQANDDAIKQAASSAFNSLESEFMRRAVQTLNNEISGLETRSAEAKLKTRQLQTELRDFQAKRRGLPDTTESRLEARRLDQAINQSLQHEIDLNNRIQKLRRTIDRERWPTLKRIR